MRHERILTACQYFDEVLVVPEYVMRRLNGTSNRVSTTSLFRRAYAYYHGAEAAGTVAGRRRIARDALEHKCSGRMWFPYYVLYQCYKGPGAI